MKEDYRNLKGQFDKLVSIEMIEAVGHHYFDTFFRTCSRLLHDKGMMLLQAITIRDQEFQALYPLGRFHQTLYFPRRLCAIRCRHAGFCCPSTDLRIFHLEDITPHYARTLREWRERFFDNIEKVPRIEFPGNLHPHVGILSVLLRRRVFRALHRECPDAADQTALPSRCFAPRIRRKIKFEDVPDEEKSIPGETFCVVERSIILYSGSVSLLIIFDYKD